MSGVRHHRAGFVARAGAARLRREWRAGELRVLGAALVVAVASLTAVGVFTERMERAMIAGAADLLAADLVLESSDPIDATLDAQAAARGLASARVLSFRSAVVTADGFQLAAVKAVGPGYPLRGRLRVADRAFAEDRIADAGPEPGTVWLDPRLFAALGLEVGESVDLGAARFEVARVLAYEPDRGGELFSIAPRLMMHIDDVPATGLVQAGSRVKHRLLLAGSEGAVREIRAWLAPRLGERQALNGIRDARPELRAALDRASRFLGLSAMVAVLLSGIAIALAARRHAARHLDDAAMLRCLGASQRTVIGIYAVSLVALGLIGSLVGAAVGLAGQAVLAELMGTLIVAELPSPAPGPVAGGVAIGLVILAGFGLPPVIALGQVPPIRVIRRDTGGATGHSIATYLIAGVTFTGLVVWQAADLRLAGLALGAGVATVGILLLGAVVLVAAAGRLRGRVGVAWRFGLANIARRGAGSCLQMVAFGLGIALLLVLTVVRGDLLRNWQENLPADAPNFFLINIQPGEVAALQAFLDREGLEGSTLHPMVRGRLVAIDDRPVSPDDYRLPRAQRLAARDFNLSHSRSMAPDNRLVAGRWWDPDAPRSGPVEISVEEGIGKALGFGLGDRLTFEIAGERVTAEVTSIRSVEWDSFHVNFFVVFAPGALEGRPSTFITAFHLDPDRREVLQSLVRQFPSVTVLDVDALLTQIRKIMEQASLGIQAVFAFTLAAGFMVLFAAIQTTADERRHETAIIRTLGATRGRVLRGLIAEFVTLGLLAGLLGSFAATAVGVFASIRVFDLPYHVDPWVWVIGALGGMVGVGVAGVLGARGVLDQPPVQTLREA